jgi:hypothetical protein
MGEQKAGILTRPLHSTPKGDPQRRLNARKNFGGKGAGAGRRRNQNDLGSDHIELLVADKAQEQFDQIKFGGE